MDVGQAKCHGDITKGPKTRHVNTGQIASFKMAVHGMYETDNVFPASCSRSCFS